MRQAELLGLPPRDFARPAELLDVAAGDLDMYDLIVGVDAASRACVLDAVAADFAAQEQREAADDGERRRKTSGGGGSGSGGSSESSAKAAASSEEAAASASSAPAPSWPPRTARAAVGYYGARVRTLAEFGAVALSDDAVLARGGFALLPRSMRRALLRAPGGNVADEEAEAAARLAAKRRRARRRPRVQWRFQPGSGGVKGASGVNEGAPLLSATPITPSSSSSAGSGGSSMASGDEEEAAPKCNDGRRSGQGGQDAADDDDEAAAPALLAELRAAGCLPQPPDLSTPEGAIEWRACVRLATWQAAALASYLISLAPDEGWQP